MSRLLVSFAALLLVLGLQVAPAFASCTYHTYADGNGRLFSCQTCCYGLSNTCHTTCF